MKFNLVGVIAAFLAAVSCSSVQLQSTISAKSNASLCYSMIYNKDHLSDEYFKLMLGEALRRDLNCKDIALDVLKFKKKVTGSNSMSPSSSGEAASSAPTESINWVTSQSPQ